MDQSPPRIAPTGKDKPQPLAASELFGGSREVEIEFRGQVYRLRITRNDKLILTK